MILGLLLSLCACAAIGDTGTLPDWSAGYDPATTPTDTGDPASYDFALRAPTDLGWESRVTDVATGGACVIEPGGTPETYASAECRMDVNELDLYGNTFAFDVTIPAGMCDYVIYSYYMYEAWEVGTGPSDCSFHMDENGNIVEEQNTFLGAPTCPYDYSPAGPNCCLGSYTLTVTQDATGQTITDVGYWGGEPSSCYDGAAFYAPDVVKTADGWPMDTIVYLGKSAWNHRSLWDPLSEGYHSNVPLANFYDPADHDGTMPAGLAGLWAQPTYTFGCYDNAQELLGQIRLTVREWNEESEFDAGGDPDTTGTEPLSGDDIDDRFDWAVATPGSDTFIQDGS